MTDNATDTPRRRRRDVTVSAPGDMSAFAVVSGDHNPIHTDRAAALLAGSAAALIWIKTTKHTGGHLPYGPWLLAGAWIAALIPS